MALKKKIRSRKGASITFALLAFMICAVVGSVVLAAALATSGRASELAESDRRYYAVTSAAQLFADSLNEQEFTVERVHSQDSVAKTDYERNGDDVDEYVHTLADGDVGPVGSGTYSVKLYAPDEDDPYVLDDTNWTTGWSDVLGMSILSEAALRYVAGSDFSDPEAVYDEEIGHEYEWEMVLSSAEYDGLKVDVSGKMSKDGSIVFTFSNDAVTGGPFKVKLTLSAGVRDNYKTPTVTSSSDTVVEATDPAHPDDPQSYTKTITTTTTTARTTWIRWSVADVKKG